MDEIVKDEQLKGIDVIPLEFCISINSPLCVSEMASKSWHDLKACGHRQERWDGLGAMDVCVHNT